MTTLKKIWWVSLLLKLILAGLIPLSADEAYYWVWSRFPQLSYFDHPPFVAWLLTAGSFLPQFLIRGPAVLLFHLGFLFWFEVLKDLFAEKEIRFWFALCLLCPLTGLGSIFVLPDLPLFFFFSGSLFFFWRALKDPSLTNHFWFGASLGLGFLSKYIIVIPTALFVLHLFLHRRWAHFRPARIFTVLAAGLIFCSPVLIWNYQNEFKSFYFQIHHGLAEGAWRWDWTAGYVVGSLLLMFPHNFKWTLVPPQASLLKLLRTLTLGGFLFFLFSSFKGSVELNWPAIFYPCLFALILPHLSNQIQKWNYYYWGAVYALLIAVLVSGVIPDLNQKMDEPVRVHAMTGLPATYRPLYASTYQLASLLWWQSQIPVYKLRGSSRYDFFDEIPESEPTENVFYLLKEPGNNIPDAFQNRKYQIEEVQVFDERHMVLRITRKDSL